MLAASAHDDQARRRLSSLTISASVGVYDAVDQRGQAAERSVRHGQPIGQQ
jgi:hypothetical protein